MDNKLIRQVEVPRDIQGEMGEHIREAKSRLESDQGSMALLKLAKG